MNPRNHALRFSIVCLGMIGLVISLTSIGHAQSKTLKILQKRSTPTTEMWKYLNRVSEFSKAEMGVIDRRSVFSASEDKIISKRSNFSAAQENAMARRSEFSQEMMDLLEKRMEPDPAQVSGVRRRSRAESDWLRVDRVEDPAMLALFLTRSRMSNTEKIKIEQASAKPDLVDMIQRASSLGHAQSKLVSGRSHASAAYMRLLRSRSSD